MSMRFFTRRNLSNILRHPFRSPYLTQTTRQQHIPIYVTFVALTAYTPQLEGLKGICEGKVVYYVSV
jgi:hypothetical protein